MEYLVTTNTSSPKKGGKSFDHKCFVDDYTIEYNEGIRFFNNEEGFLLLDGFVFDLSEKTAVSEKALWLMIKTYYTQWSNQITGQFTIVFYTKNKPHTLKLISDFVGLRHMYYGEIRSKLYISNNFTRFHDIEGIEIDEVGLFQKLTPPFYSTLGERSLFKNIYRLLPAAHLELGLGKKKYILYDFLEEIGSKKTDITSIQSLLKENGEIYNQVFDRIVLPISGGVDSRITLFSVFKEQKENKYLSLTYGEPRFIDNKIASKIAKTLSIAHFHVSIDNIYPDKELIKSHYFEGGNILLNIWLPVIEFLKAKTQLNTRNSSVVIGDILDLLRAKNIKSIRSRRQRLMYQLGFVKFNRSTESSKKIILSKLQQQLFRTHKNYLKLANNLSLSRESFIETSIKDIAKMMNHVDNLTPTNNCGYAYEEVFNILNWGSNTMGNQMRILNQYFPSFVFSANRHFIKNLLEINWNFRFEDVLTHQILRKSELSKFPTTQIPFLKYNRPILLKYAIWAIRSFVDQKIMSLGSKLKWKKNRSIDTINWHVLYSKPANSNNYQSYFINNTENFEYPLKYYSNRSSGASRPLSEIDLTAAIVPALVLDVVKSNEVTS